MTDDQLKAVVMAILTAAGGIRAEIAFPSQKADIPEGSSRATLQDVASNADEIIAAAKHQGRR